LSIFNEVAHCRGGLRADKAKLKNAYAAMSSHEHKKKPCEDCAKAAESGFGKSWHCEYHHTVQMRIDRLEAEVSRSRGRLRAAEKKQEEAEA